MNRIILIGNGFDLAHQLKTSYHHFMSDYWESFARKYPETKEGKPYKDEFITLQNTNGPQGGYDAHWGASDGDPLCKSFLVFFSKIGDVHCYNDLKLLIKEAYDSSGLIYKLTFKNKFWEHLCKTSCLETWVDIENEYYEELKKCLLSGTSDLAAVTKLNEDFEQVKSRLAVYLTKAFEQKITKNENIEAIISSLVRLDDIAVAEQDNFLDHLLFLETIPDMAYPEDKTEEEDYVGARDNKEIHKNRLRRELKNGKSNTLLHPDVLLLNFNYSPTAKRFYAETKDWDYDLIHIHGELGNPANPMIFGYGDEIDEHYQKIVNSNKNDYLKNIKSIRYLETGQYRKLLSFIESAPYQVFIMGHSCGNSDRTLLNTLFEHKNCLSIKPFYYQKDDGTDDYINIVQNISRNFKDVSLMRDRVVNKTLCEPMPQNKP